MSKPKENQKENQLTKAEICENNLSQKNTVDKQLDEIEKLPPPKKRIWEIDFFRGILILFVILDHFLYDVSILSFTSDAMKEFAKFASDYRKGTSDFGVLRGLTHDTFVFLFILLSGISSSFSRNNLKRGLRMLIFSVLFSATTFGISSILQKKFTIWFNIIHVITLCVLIYSLLEILTALLKRNWMKNICGAAIFALIVYSMVVGYYYIAKPTTELDWSFVFVKYRLWGSVTADYWTLFPSLGWFLIGAFAVKFLYKEKTTLFPSVNSKFLVPVTFIGRYSIWFYFASQIVMYGTLYFFAVVWKVL